MQLQTAILSGLIKKHLEVATIFTYDGTMSDPEGDAPDLCNQNQNSKSPERRCKELLKALHLLDEVYIQFSSTSKMFQDRKHKISTLKKAIPNHQVEKDIMLIPPKLPGNWITEETKLYMTEFQILGKDFKSDIPYH